jgi:hypothetical protein
MSIFVRYLSEVPEEYRLYGVLIANPYGTVAEKAIARNFERSRVPVLQWILILTNEISHFPA